MSPTTWPTDGTVVWFDMCEPTAADLATISEELGLHPLAVEDAVSDQQRPKLDHYPTHLFLTAYSIAPRHQVRGAVAPPRWPRSSPSNALVTVRKSRAFDIDAVVARWDERTGSGPQRRRVPRCTACSTTSSTPTSTRSSSSTPRSSRSKTTCSPRRVKDMTDAEAHLRTAQVAGQRCAGWCCRCARSSTP